MRRTTQTSLTALAIASAFAATPALAQVTGDTDTPAEDASEPVAEPSEGVADIVVTATRRSENLQDIALSVATVSDETLAVINSGVAHQHAGGDYRTRRAESERAAALLGVPALRDVGVGEMARVLVLPSPLNRRARHVITENQRVVDAKAAMDAGDATALGALFNASHASQRDDYEVSVPEVDLLVELARAEPAVFGARRPG